MDDSDHAMVSAPSPLGISWRPPQRSDVPAIVALHGVCCDNEGTYRVAASEVLDHWESRSLDPSTDTLVGFTGGGELVATI